MWDLQQSVFTWQPSAMTTNHEIFRRAEGGSLRTCQGPLMFQLPQLPFLAWRYAWLLSGSCSWRESTLVLAPCQGHWGWAIGLPGCVYPLFCPHSEIRKPKSPADFPSFIRDHRTGERRASSQGCKEDPWCLLLPGTINSCIYSTSEGT